MTSRHFFPTPKRSSAKISCSLLRFPAMLSTWFARQCVLASTSLSASMKMKSPHTSAFLKRWSWLLVSRTTFPLCTNWFSSSTRRPRKVVAAHLRLSSISTAPPKSHLRHQYFTSSAVASSATTLCPASVDLKFTLSSLKHREQGPLTTSASLSLASSSRLM